MSVRYFKGLNEDLIQEGLKMIQAGMATPAFFNDELVVPMVMEKTGCSIEEARNWGIHGCVQPGVAGCSDGRPTVGYVNMLKCVELMTVSYTHLTSPHSRSPRADGRAACRCSP